MKHVCVLPVHVVHGETGKQEMANVGLSWVLCDRTTQSGEEEQQEAGEEARLGDEEGVTCEHLEYR